jgi:hypothetical protein
MLMTEASAAGLWGRLRSAMSPFQSERCQVGRSLSADGLDSTQASSRVNCIRVVRRGTHSHAYALALGRLMVAVLNETRPTTILGGPDRIVFSEWSAHAVSLTAHRSRPMPYQSRTEPSRSTAYQPKPQTAVPGLPSPHLASLGPAPVVHTTLFHAEQNLADPRRAIPRQPQA